MTWIWFVASIGIYTMLGRAFAFTFLPRFREAAIRDWSSVQSQRESVAMQFLLMWLFWPIVLPVRLLWFSACRIIEASDESANNGSG